MRPLPDIHNPYAENEASANKHMSYALAFTAGLLVLVLFGYVFKLFDVAHDTFVMTVIVIPIVAVLLCSPLLFVRNLKRLSKPQYKYYLLSLFLFAIGVLNVIMPKHGVLGWAVCLALTAHYYNPKTCRAMFVGVLVLMAVCLFFGAFVGEFDANLLSGELDEESQTIVSFLLPDRYPDTFIGRWQYVQALMGKGENRFLKIYLNYYVGRALFVTLIFVVTNSLNKRTNVLLQSEISVNNEYQRSKTELEVAKDIQMTTLPSGTVSSKDVEILAELRAAKEVGGDLYDYLDIDEDHVAVLVGDVSGKGVPAAMFMMKTITSFRDFAVASKSPATILKEINASISKGNSSSMFVTAFLAILDKRDGTLVYANAGHNAPVVGRNHEFRYLKCKPGFLLGCFPNVPIVDESTVLGPGECLTIYTDGITEARNEAGDFFGEERFLSALNAHDFTSVVEMHHVIKEEVAAFVKEAPQSDDITYLTLTYRGGSYSYKEKEFEADKESVLEMLSMISDFGDEHHFPEDFKKQLVIVGDELISNIIKHGYAGEPGTIFLRLLFQESSGEFVLTVIDHAKPFNQLSVVNPDVGTEQSLARVGGLGLHLVKTIMTECAYDRLNDKNILVLKKRF